MEWIAWYAPVVKKVFPLHIFRETLDFRSHEAHPLRPFDMNYEQDCGWSRLTGCMTKISWIKATHQTILEEPAATQLAIKIRQAMDLHYKIDQSS
jgi:thioesterase domain-containing protein